MTRSTTTRSTLPWSDALAARLREARRRRDETQTEAAARFGITQPSYSRWELGQSSPSEQHLDALASFLGMAPDDLDRLLGREADGDDPLEAVRAELAALQREVAELRAHLGRPTT